MIDFLYNFCIILNECYIIRIINESWKLFTSLLVNLEFINIEEENISLSESKVEKMDIKIKKRNGNYEPLKVEKTKKWLS